MQRLLGRVGSLRLLAASTTARELRLLGQAACQSSGGVAPCTSVGTALPSWHTLQDLVCLRHFAASSTLDELPLVTDRQRLVVLGTGWAAARVVTDIDPKHYDLTVWLAYCNLPCRQETWCTDKLPAVQRRCDLSTPVRRSSHRATTW